MANYVGLLDSERATRLENIAASNKAKRDEEFALAARHEALDKLELQKQKDEASRRAQDFARDQLVQSLIKKGTNSIDALWEAGKTIPFSTPSVALAVETAHAKANAPQVQFGDATRQIGDQTVTGQTNQAGRFYPYPGQKTPTEPMIKLQTSDEGAPQYVTVPVTSSTNVLKSLPPDLQTNQFNTASMASIVPRPASTMTSNAPAPADAPVAPSLSPAFAVQTAINAPQPPPAPTPVAAPTVQEVSRVTPDGRVAIFNADTKQFLRYADNPTTSDSSQ